MSAIHNLAQALIDAANDHGVPNSFTPNELFHYYGAPRPMQAGRLAKLRPLYLQEQIEKRGGMFTITYSGRRFHVEP